MTKKLTTADKIQKRDKIKRKKFAKLSKKNRSREAGDGESLTLIFGNTMFYFVRSLAARGLVFFFLCILITAYNIYWK